MNERDIFLAAMDISDPAKRAAYVDRVCAGNAELRAQVTQLLRTHEESSGFLETPAAAGQSAIIETIAIDAAFAGAEVAPRSSAEAAFREYLQPPTRPGWLGRLGHYEVEVILGRGAFGIVAKAFDERLHRVVAIKMLAPELATISPPRKRFLREARSAAAVPHENLVGIHAVEDEPIPYLVMEYIPGETLQARLDQTGPLDLPDVLRIGQQIASGMAAAHQANLIHRDIKPSNILLTDGPNERVKISDFGLARAVDDASMTSSGMIAGTPMYMAPEQARGETLDHRTDLFSLGSVLYQMASGRPPFRAPTTIAVLKRVCEDTPRPITDVIPGTPLWLCAIIDRLLEKSPNDRFQSAREVADLLDRCQKELELYGQVTCVDELLAESKPQVNPMARLAAASGRKKTRWWVAGALSAMVIIVAAIAYFARGAGSQTTVADPAGGAAPRGTGEATPKPAASNAPVTSQAWYGWPEDAPPPATAPFDAQQAQAHQKAWAEFLGLPVEFTNSIGMKFRVIPPGEFFMGSSEEEIERLLKEAEEANDLDWYIEQIPHEAPMHLVAIAKPYQLAIHEVTRGQFRDFVDETGYKTEAEVDLGGFGFENGEVRHDPKFFWDSALGFSREQTDDHPVLNVTWRDATAFCDWLTKREGVRYRLPTEAEWEFACRAGCQGRFSIGDDESRLSEHAWYGKQAGVGTQAVGTKKANPFGLFDLHGNVWEWCGDAFGPYPSTAAENPNEASSASRRVLRGGSWGGPARQVRSAIRYDATPGLRGYGSGFRVVCTGESSDPKSERSPIKISPATGEPTPAIAPFTPEEAEQHQKAWANHLGLSVEFTNSIGMAFRVIPAGEFDMGSSDEEIQDVVRNAKIRDWNESSLNRFYREGPKHRVRLTNPLAFGVHEVTRGQFRQFVDATDFRTEAERDGEGGMGYRFGEQSQDPQFSWKSKLGFEIEQTDAHPVVNVSWNDAVAFCEWLSDIEGVSYRIPTEAEWEFACRAGSQSTFCFGDDESLLAEYAWFGARGERGANPVGEKKPNAFGLLDLHGNVFEWCIDRYGAYGRNPEPNPTGVAAGELRVLRGGAYTDSPIWLRSADRHHGLPHQRSSGTGFRVVRVLQE